MRSTKDTVTTVIGGLGAAITAAQPIMDSVGSGSLHQGDYVQLLAAVLVAVFGYFTNKGSQSGS